MRLQDSDWSSGNVAMNRANVDKYSITCPDIGQLKAVVLSLSDPPYSSLKSGWHLKQVRALDRRAPFAISVESASLNS
jgi:hypothetical protein